MFIFILFETIGVLLWDVTLVSILKIDLNVAEIRTVQDYVCMKN